MRYLIIVLGALLLVGCSPRENIRLAEGILTVSGEVDRTPISDSLYPKSYYQRDTGRLRSWDNKVVRWKVYKRNNIAVVYQGGQIHIPYTIYTDGRPRKDYSWTDQAIIVGMFNPRSEYCHAGKLGLMMRDYQFAASPDINKGDIVEIDYGKFVRIVKDGMFTVKATIEREPMVLRKVCDRSDEACYKDPKRGGTLGVVDPVTQIADECYGVPSNVHIPQELGRGGSNENDLCRSLNPWRHFTKHPITCS